MSTLLVQSCSRSKKEVEEPISAIELYSGYFFKIIKKTRREQGKNPDLDLCILSAKHGLLDPSDRIQPYDQRMDVRRAKELGPKVRAELKRRITEEQYDRIVINAGKDYQLALSGFDTDIDVDTYLIDGDGIGVKGGALKQFLRGDESVIEKAN